MSYQPSTIVVSQLVTIDQPQDQMNQGNQQIPIFDNMNYLVNTQRPNEDPITFAYRSEYSRVAKDLYGDQIRDETALIIGIMAAERARNGVKYPIVYENFLQHLDQQILSS